MDDTKFIVLLMLSLGSAIECKLQCDYFPFLDAGAWLKYHEEPADWGRARLQCAAEGALLASPIANLSQRMNNIVWFNAPNGVFTGIRKFYLRGSFMSVEGTSPAGILNEWAKTEGETYNSNSKENCVVLKDYSDMEEVECDQHYPYVCYNSFENVQKECGAGYTLSPTSNSCHKLHSELLTHDQAEEVCEQEGGHLVVISSEDEWKAIKTLINQASKSTNHTRIGLRKVNETWITVNGETLEKERFSEFGDGDPKNKDGHEDCGSIQRDTELFIGIPCNTTSSDFICEKNLQCGGIKPKLHMCDVSWAMKHVYYRPGVTRRSDLYKKISEEVCRKYHACKTEESLNLKTQKP